MQKLLLGVDRLSTWLGQLFAWAIVFLTLGISWEVFSRYVLGKPHGWMLDAQIMAYGILFMMAGAYTLAKNAHVRFRQPQTLAGFEHQAIAPDVEGQRPHPLVAYHHWFGIEEGHGNVR